MRPSAARFTPRLASSHFSFDGPPAVAIRLDVNGLYPHTGVRLSAGTNLVIPDAVPVRSDANVPAALAHVPHPLLQDVEPVLLRKNEEIRTLVQFAVVVVNKDEE